MANISLLIADDHQVVRLGLKNLLDGTNINVVAEATNGEEVLSKVATHKPNAVLLDVRMPGGDGLHIIGRLKLDYPELPVLIFSTYDNPTYVARAVALGAFGLCTEERLACAADRSASKLRSRANRSGPVKNSVASPVRFNTTCHFGC